MNLSALKRLGETHLEPILQSYFIKDTQSERTRALSSPPVSSRADKLSRALVLFLAGAGAGLTATTLTYPFDIMRTQFAVQGNNPLYPTMESFISSTYKAKGVKG